MKTFLKSLNSIEKINFIYLLFLMFLSFILLFKEATPFITNNVLLYTTLLIIIFYINYNKERFSGSSNKIIRYIFANKLYNLIYLVLFVPLIFGSLEYIVPYFFPPADHYLARIDSILLFNFPLFQFLDINVNRPLLNAVLQIIYIIYFFLPLVVVTAHFLLKDYKKIEEDIFYITLGLYLCYIGYILVPAFGPRFYYSFQHPLAGGTIFTTLNDLLNQLERNKLDAFPSAHIEMGLLVTFLVRKNKILFPLFVIEFIGIVIATILLRYHYIIDIIAGVLFFIVTYYVGKILYKE